MSEWVDKIVQGHVLDVLERMPSDFVDVVVTSPPYWGLRSYGVDCVAVWDGKAGCEHKWDLNEKFDKNWRGGTTNPEISPKQSIKGTTNYSEVPVTNSQFCVLCGAWKGQLCLEPHPSLYIKHLVEVMHLVKRVLKPSGSLWLDMGDTYFGGKGQSGRKDHNLEERKAEGRTLQKREWTLNEQDAPQDLCKMNDGWLQPKQKMLIPERIAVAMQEQGWILRNSVCWHKVNHMPSSVRDRLSNAYETVYFFVKKGKYYFDLDAIRKPHQEVSRSRVQSAKDRITKPMDIRKIDSNIGTIPQRSSIDGIVVELNPLGANPGDLWQIPQSKFHGQEFGSPREHPERATEQHPLGSNPSDVWSLTTEPFKDAHFAVFPQKLVRRILECACPRWICRKCGRARTRITQTITQTDSLRKKDEGSWRNYKGERWNVVDRLNLGWSDCGCNAGFDSGIVLDPFIGSGTTGVVARKMGLHYVGIELKPAYMEMARKRLSQFPERLEFFLNNQKEECFNEQ